MVGSDDGRSWYQVMGVEDHAPVGEVRAAYLRLARALHPDRHAEAPEAERTMVERRMREVNAAWAVLGDDESRRVYDIRLRSARRYSTPS